VTLTGQAIEHELAMIKVRGTGDRRTKALDIANDFDARVVDDTVESFVFEVSGSTDKIERCIAALLPLGLIEVSRSGIVAITRGPEGM
jgi:acetolactate synthase I/III small subunit